MRMQLTSPAINIDDAPALVFSDSDPVVPAVIQPASEPEHISGRSQFQASETVRFLSFNLAKVNLEDTNSLEIPVFHSGEFFDWRYGDFELTASHFKTMKRNFEKKALHPNSPLDRQIALQVGHGFLSEPEAVGWAISTRVEKEGDLTFSYMTFELNETGKELIGSGKYAFVSPSFDMNYIEQKIVDGKRQEHGPTIFHVALTNSPVLAELPSIALSRTLTPMDVKFSIQKEAVMENGGEGTDIQVTTPDPPAQPQEPQPSVPSKSDPPKMLSIPEGSVVLDKVEYEKLNSQIQTLTTQFETQAKKAHEYSVDGLIKEAAGRGVPPVVLAIVKPIMLAAHPEAKKTINLSKEDGTPIEMNIFEAMGELLKNIPTIELGQRSREPAGSRPNQELSLDDAEAAGVEMWKKSGIIPTLVTNGKKGS